MIYFNLTNNINQVIGTDSDRLNITFNNLNIFVTKVQLVL
jgi:hypothetical protein